MTTHLDSASVLSTGSNATLKYAYHYTTSYYALAICESGVIEAATAFVPRNETPVVWFSSNPFWEPTASKAAVCPATNAIRNLTFPEMVRIGIARFAVSTTTLAPWREIPVVTGMSAATWDALKAVARHQGADHRQWFVSALPVVLTEDVVLQLYLDGQWTTHTREHLRTLVTTLRRGLLH